MNTSNLSDAYVAFAAAYKDDRVEFVRKVLSSEPSKWQLEVLQELDAGATRVAIKSGHGVGKTALLSWIALHFCLTRYPQKTVVTAPTAGQLFDALAAEVRLWLARLPDPLKELFIVKRDRIEHAQEPSNSFISYRTSRAEQPEALQGIHSDNVLLIGDEASGIPNAVYEAAGGSLSTIGSIFVLAGNPTKAEGYFYNLFNSSASNWKLHTVSGEDCERVDPAFVAEVGELHGIESNVYRVRVLGEFPTFNVDKLIPLHLIESAVQRDIKTSPTAPIVWGLDVSRSGADRTALVERRGRVITSIWARPANFDLMKTVGWVKHMYDEAKPSQKPVDICVDAIGLGAGVGDRLTELGLPVSMINVAEIAALNQTAFRLRDDLWLQVKAWFEKADVSIPDDPALIRDLTAPSFSFASGGQLKVSSKDEMRKAGYKSPDLGDALCLTFAAEGVSALYGSDGPQSMWNQPIEQEELAIV